MTYLGIDQSYSGFALTVLEEDDHDTVVGKFDPKKYGTGVDRLMAISDWLERAIGRYTRPQEVDHICMEGYSMGSKFGREKAGELGATVKMTLLDTLPVPTAYPTIVSPTALKKFVLGGGKGGKNEMLLGVYKRWDAEFSDDNAADSYALARLAQAIDNPEGRLKYELEVIKKLQVHTEDPGEEIGTTCYAAA